MSETASHAESHADVIVPALVALRVRRPEVHRPYRVPGGTRGVWICGVLVYAWIVLGSWDALFPRDPGAAVRHPVPLRGHLGRLAGPLRDIHARHGAALLAVAAVGYAVAEHRRGAAANRSNP